jgi:hypothetical protein
MKALLPLFVFVDACGWEIIRDDPFVKDMAPYRRRLESVFGYSSACVPSILSGQWPADHRHWCFFVYDPEHSPFRALRPLRWLPSFITSRRRFRSWLSRRLKVRLNFRGYFDLYNIPFRYISLFDFTEKKSPLKPGGMNRGVNICDFLLERQITHYFADPEKSEDQNWKDLLAAIPAESIDFAFLYWPELDGLLHRVGNQSPEISTKLRAYERRLGQLLVAARAHYEEVRLYVFSDHGMANCDRTLDLRSRIDALDLRMGQDYVVVYDSTMARFWFKHDRARQAIIRCLATEPLGRILPDSELAGMRALFEDRYFGELIFLVQEGVLIIPSHMGERPLRGMHGYHPSAPHSYACLCTNQPDLPETILAIPDLYRLMTRDAELAKSLNRRR